MQLKDALASAVRRFEADHVPSPRTNAELLLMFTLGVDRAYFYAHPERELTDEESRRYNDALAQRSRGIPAQYITGHQEFWGMDFIVTPAVLIPRPETEHVIEKVLELSKHFSPASRRGEESAPDGTDTRRQRPTTKGLRPSTAEVGTGSGCIAIALAKEFPDAEIHATDISEPALEIARANAARHRADNIQFHHANLLNGLQGESFDFIVSNPPYVGESEEDQVQLEVRKFEPRNAVFAGPTGVEVIAQLVPAAHRVLKPHGFLVMEISGTIADSVRKLFETGWSEIALTKDLQGISRVISARRS